MNEADSAADVQQSDVGEKFYGKYRGTVVNNLDPMQLGRIQVMVPDVFGLSISSWAMPCVPIAGKQQGIFVLPQVGSGVWIEFEQGEPDYPIWVGGFGGLRRKSRLWRWRHRPRPRDRTSSFKRPDRTRSC